MVGRASTVVGEQHGFNHPLSSIHPCSGCLSQGRHLQRGMPHSSCVSMSFRDKLFVLSMSVVLVALTANYAILVTFFPLYAKAEGMSSYAVSMIFTAFSVANLVGSPIAGALASFLGRRAVLIWGVLQVSASGCFIGFTPEIAGNNVTLQCVLFTTFRAVQGAGVAFARLSIFAVLSDTFPDNRGLVIGSAVSMIALGFMIGPPIGGSLYALSGFRLPFLFLSVLVVVCAVPTLLLWPGARAQRADDGGTCSLAAADSAAAVDPTVAMAERVIPGAEEGADAPSTAVRPSWCRLLALLPCNVFLVCLIQIVFESKWAMWDIHVVEWLVDEFHMPIPHASLHISIVAATFALGCPLGGWIGDQLGARRLHMVVILLFALFALYLAMGPWQLHSIDRPSRQHVLYFYLVADGALSTLLEPQLMPEMLRLAEEPRRPPPLKDGSCKPEERQAPNEHLTNFVTAFGQFGMNAGAILGPFAAVPILEMRGFRGTLAIFGGVYAIVAALTALRLVATSRQATQSSGAPASRTSSVELPGVTEQEKG